MTPPTPAMTAQEALAFMRAQGSFGWEFDSPSVTIADVLERAIADYEEQAADHRRNVRLIDIAMHGEEGAAKQASSCDLIEPARQMRERLADAERRATSWEHSWLEAEGQLTTAQSRLSAVEADIAKLRGGPSVVVAIMHFANRAYRW